MLHHINTLIDDPYLLVQACVAYLIMRHWHTGGAVTGAAAALISNESGEVLIVKPTYKAGWSLPGGVIEDGESPMEACKRECLEELALEVTVGKLLCCEFHKGTSETKETTKFIFDGGVISATNQIIKLQRDELETYRFVSFAEAISLISEPLANRLRVLKAGETVYFET